MLFNSIDFAIFLPIVFILYWFATFKSLKVQNFLVVIASYVFYGWWDWRFLSLIFFSTIVDFIIGNLLFEEENKKIRKTLLWTSIIINLGFLGFFKYYNFFLDNFITAFSFFGATINANSLNIILPVGISFYTFQTLSYSIDVYNKKLNPTRDFIAFSAFVCFFPQLVAGPIERATNLLPQFYIARVFEYKKAIDGLRQILWGLFKKIVIADNCATYANITFNNSGDYGGGVLLVGAVLFSFQIYGDFSGYSDIAIGTSRLFGFNLKQNFAFPYFSRDIAEFWRRWHMSLSTWFRDYLYIPLGGSQKGLKVKIINTFIIFIVSGFWHGANWTFIIWGLLNALYFMPLMLLNINRLNINAVAEGNLFPTVRESISVLITFILTVVAWIFFRAENISHAYQYLLKVLFNTLNNNSIIEAYNFIYWKMSIAIPILILFFLCIEWLGREKQHALETLGLNWKKKYRWTFYYALILVMFFYSGKEQQFIYFQF